MFKFAKHMKRYTRAFFLKQLLVFTGTLLLFAVPLIVKGQDAECGAIDDKKALQLYAKAKDMQKYTQQERMVFLKQAIDLQPDYVDAIFMYAEELAKEEKYEQKSYAPAAAYFKKVIDLCPKYHSDPYYFIGRSNYDDEKYDDAITYLQKFLNFKDDDEKKFSKKYDDYLYQAKGMIKYSKFYIDILKNKVPFDPYPVSGLSTKYDEYLACISP